MRHGRFWRTLSTSATKSARVDLVESLDGCAILAAAENRLEQAISLMCTATEHRAAMEHPMSPAEQEFLERWLLPARRILGEDATAEACSTGAASSIETSHCNCASNDLAAPALSGSREKRDSKSGWLW